MCSKLKYEDLLNRLACSRDNLSILVGAFELSDPLLSNAIHCIEYELIDLHDEFSKYYHYISDQLDK